MDVKLRMCDGAAAGNYGQTYLRPLPAGVIVGPAIIS